MLTNWLFRLLIPYWETLIENPATGKPSLKNMAATVGFIVGIGLASAVVVVQLWQGRQPDTAAIMLLLANGLGLSALKVYQQQLNRRTADEAGQPLAVPPPADHAPEVMPQVENPNAE